MSIGGKDSTWKHGTNASPSSNTDYTTSAMAVTPNFNLEEADATVFGNGYRSYEATFANAEIDVTYYYTTAMFSALALLYANRTEVSWEIGPTGTGSGNVKITGDMVMLNLGVPLQVGDVIKLPVKWRVTGAVTFATF